MVPQHKDYDPGDDDDEHASEEASPLLVTIPLDQKKSSYGLHVEGAVDSRSYTDGSLRPCQVVPLPV